MTLTLENISGTVDGPLSASISPDGKWVAIVANGDRGRGIYLMAASGGKLAWWRAGTSPAWSPDGNWLAYEAQGGLWVAARAGGDSALRLTQGVAGPRAPVFSPDGGSIAFYATPDKAQDIWVVRSNGSASPRRLIKAAAAVDDPRFKPAWSPDGRQIAFVSNRADYWMDDIWSVDVASGAARQLTHRVMASSTPVWSPTGDRIAVFGTAKNEYWYQDLAYIYIVDPVALGSERPLKMEVYATDGEMQHRPFWSGDGRKLYFPYMQRGNYDLWAVADTGGLATRVTNIGGAARSFDASAGAEQIVFIRSGPTEGPEVYRVNASGGPSVRLTQLSPGWEGIRAPREVSYRTFDGLYIQGFLYLPPQAAEGKRCPALVNVHGGGTNSYLQGLNLTEQYLASRGFVVLSINYRGGSGFGRPFQDLAVGDWMGNQALDAGAATDYLRGLPFVDGKVGIYGGSYGGSMSLAAATRTPDKFDAVVAMRGAYTDETKTFDETDRLGKIFTKTGHGGLPNEKPDAYRVSNTVERLGQLKAPVLLMHGEADHRVAFASYEQAVAKLKALGKEFESHSYPGEGHGFHNVDDRVDMNRRLEAFFNEHLGPCTR